MNKAKTGFMYNGKATSVVSAGVNSVLASLKIIGGIITNSSALLADGVHSLTDLLSDLFTYVMFKISREDADETHPYGHGKFDTFGAFFIATLLFVTGVAIAIHAVHKHLDGHSALNMGFLALAFAFLSILANEGLYLYCKKVGENIKSKVIIANGWHHRVDSLSSVAAVIGIAGSMAGYTFLDTLAAIVIAIILCKAAWNIGKSSFNELMDGAVERSAIKQMGRLILQQEGVLSMHHLRARRLGSDIFVDVHVEVEPFISVSEGHAISENVTAKLRSYMEEVEDVTVHIDPKGEKNGAYPAKFSRQKLELKIYSTVEKILETSEKPTVVLHLLRENLSAELHFSAETKITKQQAEKIQTLLEKEGFEMVIIAVRV